MDRGCGSSFSVELEQADERESFEALQKGEMLYVSDVTYMRL